MQIFRDFREKDAHFLAVPLICYHIFPQIANFSAIYGIIGDFSLKTQVFSDVLEQPFFDSKDR